MRIFLITLLLSVYVPAIQAQNVNVTLVDGSSIRGKFNGSQVVIKTAYGNLTIPIEDLYEIKMGLYIPEDTEKLITLLGSENHKEREKANIKLIGYGKNIVNILQNHKTVDPEIKTRLTNILKDIKVDQVINYDSISAKNMSVTGKILGDGFVINGLLGELGIKLKDIDNILFQGNINKVIQISPDKDWVEVAHINLKSKLVITASGQVDLWPKGPGQFVCNPNGHTSQPNGSNYKSGSLIAKINEGLPFIVGENYSFTNQTGKVYLRIERSSWNNLSIGSYQVRVKNED